MTKKQRNNIMRSRNKKPLTEMTIAYCDDESQRYYFERMKGREFALNCWLMAGSFALTGLLIYGLVKAVMSWIG